MLGFRLYKLDKFALENSIALKFTHNNGQ